MSGSPIASVRTALSLPAECTFNIFGFSSTFSSVFDQLRDYSDESLSVAQAHIDHLDADKGETATASS
jgi:hypothetical protein